MRTAEAHVEQLLGRRMLDIDGLTVGRLEEFRVELIDGEAVVTEFHVGGAALLERIAGFVTQLPFLSLLPFVRTEYRIRWQDVDLSDARHPRLRVRRAELHRAELHRAERARPR
jgi:hypothetical protein